MIPSLDPPVREALRAEFGERLERDAALAPYTSARVGGPAEYLLTVASTHELVEAATRLWELEVPFRILGGGSNVLVAEAGVRGVVVLNRARDVRFREGETGPVVWAASGASFGGVARRTAERGLSGLEWAATIPGTVGGAVVGNAGAHGKDTAGSLRMVAILQQDGRTVSRTAKQLDYDYRTSWLKRNPGKAVVLSATFKLEQATPEEVQVRMKEFGDYRRETQPTGASWGSMFKNPEGDFAGRLIEEVGLKGLRRGGAEVNEHHANFFVNKGEATAGDVWALITEVQRRVAEETGVELELEIEPIGAWQDVNSPAGIGSGE